MADLIIDALSGAIFTTIDVEVPLEQFALVPLVDGRSLRVVGAADPSEHAPATELVLRAFDDDANCGGTVERGPFVAADTAAAQTLHIEPLLCSQIFGQFYAVVVLRLFIRRVTFQEELLFGASISAKHLLLNRGHTQNA